MKTSRRNFLKIGTVASSGLFIPFDSCNAKPNLISQKYNENELLSLSFDLLGTWCKGLISMQITDPKLIGLQGGIICPACARIHGRVGYAIFPFMFMAEQTKDQTYLNAALNVYDWMERSVSFPDGSWVNDVNVSLWKGITVCTAITLAETLVNYEHLLDRKTYDKWKARLIKSSDYLYENFNIYTGNINYPATCSYALSFIGDFLDIKKYKDKGKQLGDECKGFFTAKDKFLFGEGKPQDMISPKGCRFVDLGYNVEESLPSLVLYGKLVQDKEIMELVTESLKTHAEFMLPDGAWDNSWGSRSFKWSYWGGTTSDGCQHAYGLLADKIPEFYGVALQNVRLQKECTHDNLLYGGLHTKQNGLLPCVHPSFTHIKSLATMLHQADSIKELKIPEKIAVPRSGEYGVKEFSEIQTWLIAKNNWKGTITCFDLDYDNNSGGHPTGGALSMLYHEKTGPLFCGSMTRYQLIEPSNMQMQPDTDLMPLTPRVELEIGKSKYLNIYDKEAKVNFTEGIDEVVFNTYSRLINEKQEDVIGGKINCQVSYTFRKDEFIIKVSHDSNNKNIRFIAPVISANNEKVVQDSNIKLHVLKSKCKVTIESNNPIQIIETEKGRMFSFIPGLEAIPLAFSGTEIEIKITIN